MNRYKVKYRDVDIAKMSRIFDVQYRNSVDARYFIIFKLTLSNIRRF